MSHHVFARVRGFGWTLLPLPPYRLGQVPGDDPVLLVRHDHPDGRREACLSFDESPPRVELSPGTSSLEEVVEMSEGPADRRWTIETTPYAFAWPAGFTLASWPEPRPPAFGLHGPDDALITLQGPFRAGSLPAGQELAAPGQAVVREGRTAGHYWVELAYTHEGRPWVQRQYVVALWEEAFVLVSTQAPQHRAEETARAADEVAATLVGRA
jgi:hypothetical protein